jgi:pimeloyl-ACP methyl ester carboxylesterase
MNDKCNCSKAAVRDRRSVVGLWLALLVALCGGCTYIDLLTDSYSEESPPAQRFQFRDGGEAIFFVLDKSLEPLPQVPDTYLFVISGSDCTSMKYWLPRYFRGLEGESGPMRIFVVHKRFIEERSWGRFNGCSEAFIRSDHPRRWVADYTEFIESRLRLGRPKRVVLLGISEGGEVVPLLARQVAGVTHLALLASGGMDSLAAYRMQARQLGLDEQVDIVTAMQGVEPPEPADFAIRIGGRTRRYWSELRELEPTHNLLGLAIPILVGMGEADRSLPIETAWQLRDDFAEHGKTNLTLLTFEGADHFLFDQASGVSRLPDFWHQLDLWLME